MFNPKKNSDLARIGKSKTKYKRYIAIIGAGPAGMAAALQLHRFGYKPLLFEKDIKNGSLLTNAWRVENYLGTFPALSGIELLKKLRKHVVKSGIQIVSKEVQELDYNKSQNKFAIKTTSCIYKSDRVIIASGTMSKKLPVAEQANLKIKGHIHYSVAPLLTKKNKTIAIIGAGDAAFDYALNLAQRGNKIHLINHGSDIKALQLLQKKVFANKKIIYKENQKILQITAGKEKNLHCLLENNRKKFYIDADYLIVAIGRTPQKDFYSHKFAVCEMELIKKGLLFLAGDVQNNIYRQVAIAVSDGIFTAMKIREK